MSISAPRGLASSGQKPITEILHPLSAAEEPLSPGPDVTVSGGRDKVGSDGASPTVGDGKRTLTQTKPLFD